MESHKAAKSPKKIIATVSSSCGVKVATVVWCVIIFTTTDRAEIFEDYILPLTPKESGESSRTLNMQLDLFIPKLNLAFEYQGQQHFQDVFFFGITRQYIIRDELKKKYCEENEITLIDIPYWWDKCERTVADMITAARPDIIIRGETK